MAPFGLGISGAAPGLARACDVAVNGKVAVKQAYIVNLDGSTLKPLKSAGDTAALEGTRVLISDAAAGLVNKTFGTDAVKEGVLVGIAKITVNTR
jgi:hypothetical protein